MSTVSYQDRLVQLGRDFDKLVLTGTGSKGEWLTFEIKYSGKEVFDGILNEDADIFIKKVSHIGGEVLIRFSVKCNQVGRLNKKIVVFFDPESPFYKKDENNVVQVSDKKLRRQIDIQLQVVSSFDKEVFDAGTIKSGSKVSFEFNYLGQKPITGVKGSCGCTDVKFEHNKIYGTIDTTDFKSAWGKSVTVYFGEHERLYESINGIFFPNTKVHNATLTVKGMAVK